MKKVNVKADGFRWSAVYWGLNKKNATLLAKHVWMEKLAILERGELGYVPAASPESCPLCTLYFHNGCAGCPVMEKTGLRRCHGTPIEEYEISVRRRDIPAAIKAAKDIVEGLRKLREEELRK